MKLNNKLFEYIAQQAALSPRLRMHYDLRDTEEENRSAYAECFITWDTRKRS